MSRRLLNFQPVGLHSNSCEVTPYCVNKDGMAVLDEWLLWLWTRLLVDDGLLAMIDPHRPARP